jgi:phosphoglycolate phosphatase-like HAD superfamily hydrolase
LSCKHGDTAAVLFDIDGTLVDSNYLHTHAWQRAFAAAEITVPAWRIHRAIGMDGTALVKSLSGNAPDDVQTRLKDLHSRYYKETAPMLRALPGARELLAHVAGLGLKVVFTTSAPEDELSLLRGVLGSDRLVAEMTSDADVDTAKPDSDIIHVALDRAGTSANRAVFVGDAIWDAQACTRAQITCLGVLSGGISRAELENAGAAMVFTNAAHLLRNLATTPIAQLATVGCC